MINFENIKIETGDLRQAAVSGAKIIDRHAHSRSPGAVQRRASQSRESLPLRHFARNSAQMRRKLQLLDQPQNLAASQYHGGNIDADVKMLMSFEERDHITPDGSQDCPD